MYKNSKFSMKMVATETNKGPVELCSTPERLDSPSRDSDSLCDSDAASPVPFLCTQDGAEGETDVVWNYYTTPRVEHKANSRFRNSTPLSRKPEKSAKLKLERHLPKRRAVKPTQLKSELLQDLIELNQNLHELMGKNNQNIDLKKPQSGSEDDLFSDSPDVSPKSGIRSSSRCLRKNLLSSKFSKAEVDPALESDDSMNECLLKASQVVEEKLLNYELSPAKKSCHESGYVDYVRNCRPDFSMKIGDDSMDAIFSKINVESSSANKKKNLNSSHLNNDTFDSLVGNLNDSALERLTQMPVNNDVSDRKRKNKGKNQMTDWTVKEVIVHDGSPLSKSFGRHSSMPESPSLTDINRPSCSGMVFGRYSSMPYGNKGDSPIKCTQDEIKKKHQQAREKLLAKRLLPFTTQQCSQPVPTQLVQHSPPKKTQFQPKVPSSRGNKVSVKSDTTTTSVPQSHSVDLRSLIEKKRQEALNKLRRRQNLNKT